MRRFLLPLLLLAFVLAGCGTDEPPADAADAHAGHDHDGSIQTASADGQKWTCGMHPQIVEDEPGFCPICGMALTAMKQTASSEGIVEISAATVQNMGVRTAEVAVQPLSRRLRTTGRFEASEERMQAVSPKISGWVERLYVDYEGAQVNRGQPLLEIYSPELVATQEEYLLALRHAERLGGSDEARRLVEAARRRLAYWDVSEAQIERPRATGEPQKTVTLHAPASGTVTQKNVTQGQEIRAGQTLMHLTDLSRLWLMIDLYERDLAWVDTGDEVRVELPYAPGEAITGRIDHIYDTLDPATRTARARITVPNPERRLKPGMYATALLSGDAAEPMPTVLSEAVVRTGERAVVVLALGDGRFRPVPVETGLESDGQVQILSGLDGGEEVVTSAQFLIDSEAQLQSAVGAMASGHDHGSMGDAAPTGKSAEAASASPAPIDVASLDANRDGQVFLCTGAPHEIADVRADLPDCSMGEIRELTIGATQTLLHNEGYAAPVDPARADRNGDGVVYQDSMDWAVIHDAPGRCEVCGMELKEVTLDEARQNLKAAGYALTE